MYFQDDGRRILNFTESLILGHSDPRMANVYRPIKLDADIIISDRDMAKIKTKSKMAAAAVLYFQRMQSILDPSSPRTGLYSI